MPVQPGRFHKRIRLAISVKLVDPADPKVCEDVLTENVSPSGARILVKTRKQPDTLMLVKSPTPIRASGRVVYCEPLPNGEFAVGLQLQGPSLNWPTNPMGPAA